MKIGIYFAFLATISFGGAINRPVYKIILTQKGFAQFLQYDIDTPPLREFTFCTWIKFYDFTRDQTMFNYIVHGRDNVLRLWLDSGGRYMKISLNGKISSSNAVDLTKDVWQHLCLSYQSDYGAWALYIDGRLVSCEVAQSLQGFVLPAGGSVIVGYGTSNDGGAGGLEGEIFGANMILTSTIERNHTMKRNPQFKQKYFHKNRLTSSNDIKYVILSDMQTATSHQDFDTTTLPSPSTTRSYISIKTPYSVVNHDVGIDLSSRKPSLDEMFEEKDSWGISPIKSKRILLPHEDDKISFWNLIEDARISTKRKGIQSSPNTNDFPSVYEMPPPTSPVYDYSKFVTNPFPLKRSSDLSTLSRKTIKLQNTAISNIKASQLTSNDNKINAKWSNANFANSVLNYLKANNLNLKVEHRRVPPTIPLIKISDSFPYASDFRSIKAYTPYIFHRRNIFDKPHKNMKRDLQNHQINVQIVHDDDRTRILKSHTEIKPVNVEITNKGEIKRYKDSRFYRNADNSEADIILSDVFKPRPFSVKNKLNKTFLPIEFRKNRINTILPFIKSTEYVSDDQLHKDKKNDIYTKSLSSPNKWHNVKSYNNDFTPRKINIESGEIQNYEPYKLRHVQNKKLPSIRLKYIPDNHKIVKSDVDGAILKGRNLALQVSNLSDPFSDSVSILKYNHGFLPGHSSERKRKTDTSLNNNFREDGFKTKNNFNQNIKIGNALNERVILGDDERQKHRSFVGGNENVPDINRYRSDLDKVDEHVPPSLGAKICKNLEFFDRLLYIQPDGSIDITHILSPVKEKNIGIAFITQNYKKCSLQESIIENHPLLFIDWNNTPVRLFGGATPRKTTDLCGFF